MPSAIEFRELPATVQESVRSLHNMVARGQFQKAIPGLAQVVSDHPGYVTASVLLGRALRMSGQLERSYKVFLAASQVASDDPGVQLGLAWMHLDARRYAEAKQLAEVAANRSAYKGDAFAVIARVQEALGETEAAAQSFLRAYQAGLQIPWLREHCALVKRPFHSPDSEQPAPWPLTPAQRLCLYRHVEQSLVAVARTSGLSLDPGQVLTVACDHTTRWTTDWAEIWEVDVVDLYQALLCRGGFCDCEVVLNAARADDTALEVIVMAGRFRCDAQEALASLRDSLQEGVPPEVSLERDDEEEGSAELAVAEVDEDGLVVPLQRVAGSVLADLVEDLPSALEDGDQAELWLLYPDASPIAECVRAEATRTECTVFASLGSSDLASEGRTWVRATLDQFQQLVPVCEPGVRAGRLELPQTTGTGPGAIRLVGHSPQGWHVWNGDGSRQALGLTGESLVVARSERYAAWLSPFRTRTELILEDRERGLRECLACDDFGSSLAFCCDESAVLAVCQQKVVAYELASHKRTTLFSGAKVSASPRREWIAVEHADASFEILDHKARTVVSRRAGRDLVWSPSGEQLAYLMKVEGEGHQAFLLECHSGLAHRVSPKCCEACWVSFADSGQSIVMYVLQSREWIPLGDGRSRASENESLVKCGINGDAPLELWSSYQSTRRIVRPLAHPTLPLVAFRTQESPKVGIKLVLWIEGRLETFAQGEVRPVQWLVG